MGVFDIKSYVYEGVDFSLMGNQIIRDIENKKSNTMVVFETAEEMISFVAAYREVFDADLASYWKSGFAHHVFNAGHRVLTIDKACNELWITDRARGRTENRYHVVYFKDLIVSESFEDFNESALPIKSLFCV